MIKIIISLDYEVFGDGSGSVLNDVIRPTDRILAIAGKYGVPVTIMFEICEFMKYEEFDGDLQNDLGYSPAGLMKEQVQRAFKAGHDVQLHIHPQWADAVYKGKKWVMKDPWKEVGDLTAEEAVNLIEKSKEKLVSVLREIDAGYECTSARFTGYNWVQASTVSHEALKKAGIKAHSLADHCPFDGNRPYWPLDGAKELYEIPIFSQMIPKYRMFTVMRIWTALYLQMRARVPILSRKLASEVFTSRRGLVGILGGVYCQKWDFCKQTAGEMLMFLEKGMERFKGEKADVPMVMIGHANIFFNDRGLEKFLKRTAEKYLKDGSVRFSTFREFVSGNLGRKEGK